jgi:hypothetical protein
MGMAPNLMGMGLTGIGAPTWKVLVLEGLGTNSFFLSPASIFKCVGTKLLLELLCNT